MKTDRRRFLRGAAAGVAVAGVGQGASWASSLNSPFGTGRLAASGKGGERALVGAAQSLGADTAERQRLIEMAHFGRKEPAASNKGMAICSHPLATRAAVNVLKNGGNACDAALCASATQTVVEPHMTTITGMLSMLYYDAARGETTYVNGDVNAPLAPLPGFNARDLAGGRGVAVPGWWGGFEAAHARHGRAPKPELLAPAIHYARDGFETHPFLWGEIFVQSHLIGRSEQGREMYMTNNALPRPGEMLYQKRAADTLEQLAEEGNDYFYRGGFAEKFCEIVQQAGGVLTREDFERWEPRWDEPAHGTYRGYEIAASPPPDNGGTHIIEMLNMVELMDTQKLGPPTDSPETLYQFARIHNLVYEEGGKQNDPTSHPLPLEIILSKEYARMRFELLQMSTPKPSGESMPNVGSNHVTVIDGDGNVATIIHSCMSLPWSNGLFVDGISICAAGAHFFRVMPKPGHRITAYVAPNIVFQNGKPILASGSPSVGLLANVLQNTVNILDFGIPIEESVNRPRFGGRSFTVPGMSMIEVDLDPKVRNAAAAKGLPFDVVNPWNWHHGAFEGIYIDPTTRMMSACGDPRRCSRAEGV